VAPRRSSIGRSIAARSLLCWRSIGIAHLVTGQWGRGKHLSRCRSWLLSVCVAVFTRGIDSRWAGTGGMGGAVMSLGQEATAVRGAGRSSC